MQHISKTRRIVQTQNENERVFVMKMLYSVQQLSHSLTQVIQWRRIAFPIFTRYLKQKQKNKNVDFNNQLDPTQ